MKTPDEKELQRWRRLPKRIRDLADWLEMELREVPEDELQPLYRLDDCISYFLGEHYKRAQARARGRR